MLKKAKDLGSELSSKAADVAQEIGQSVKNSMDNLTQTTTEKAGEAGDKAIRTAVEQMRYMLEVTMAELKQKPISEQPATVTASITVGIVSLQIEVAVPAASGTVSTASLPSATPAMQS